MSFAERESPSSSRRAPSVLHCPIRAVVFIATCPFLTPVAGTRLGLFRDGASSAGAPPATGRSDWELPPAAAPTPTGTFSLSRRCYTPSPQRRMENDPFRIIPPVSVHFPCKSDFHGGDGFERSEDPLSSALLHCFTQDRLRTRRAEGRRTRRPPRSPGRSPVLRFRRDTEWEHHSGTATPGPARARICHRPELRGVSVGEHAWRVREGLKAKVRRMGTTALPWTLETSLARYGGSSGPPCERPGSIPSLAGQPGVTTTPLSTLSTSSRSVRAWPTPFGCTPFSFSLNLGVWVVGETEARVLKPDKHGRPRPAEWECTKRTRLAKSVQQPGSSPSPQRDRRDGRERCAFTERGSSA
jgi:hypothetical protein